MNYCTRKQVIEVMPLQTIYDLREQLFWRTAIKWDTTNEKLIQNNPH